MSCKKSENDKEEIYKYILSKLKLIKNDSTKLKALKALLDAVV